MDQVICTVDVVLLTLHEEELKILLLQRELPPFAQQWALPGGFIHAQDADAEAAANRVLRDKTGLTAPYLEQLASFSGPQRDPRGWSVSIVYYALIGYALLMPSEQAQLHSVDQLPPLAFDHAEIIARTLARLRSKSQYSSLPCYLLGEKLTLPQLQKVYEIVLGEKLNKSDFRRKIIEMDMLEELPGEFLKSGAFRPAQVYRLKTQQHLNLRQRGI